MISERFPLPPPELAGNGALYDYLYNLAERWNLLMDDLPESRDTAPAAAESPLSARQTRALVQRTVEGLTAADIHGGALSCDSATVTGTLTAGGNTAVGGALTVTGASTLGTTGASSLTVTGASTLGTVSCGDVTGNGDITVAGDVTSGGDLTCTGTVALSGDTALTLHGETLADYVQRCIAAAISNEEENT